MDGTKLAGPAGSYDGGQKMSSQKRKRDKAQEQLRTRMRQRMNGNANSSTILHSKRRSALFDGGKNDASLSAGVRHSATMEVTPRDLQGNNFWRTQQDRYNTLTTMSGMETGIQAPGVQTSTTTTRQTRTGAGSNQTVPLQELVDRVLHRKEHNFGLGTKVSPMTIRAYKPPVAPYAIQQSSHVKKIVKMKPIQRAYREDKGPFVLVLQRNKSNDSSAQPLSNRASNSRSFTDASGDPEQGDSGVSTNGAQVLPPVNGTSSRRRSSELKTWRPALDAVHQPAVLPEAEDRSVTNYRLQLQQANKLAESRFEFNHQVPATQTVEEITMQTLNPLPPIQGVYTGEGESAGEGSQAEELQTNGQNGDSPADDRTASKAEILNLKRAQKEAKRQKQSEAEEFTLLKTRKRFTNKTKQFKSELERARQLSAIQEDRSSLSSARLNRLSARKATFSSSSTSSSLRSIDESNSTRAASDSGSESGSDSERTMSQQSQTPLPAAPPTTPSLEAHDQAKSDVIMNVALLNSAVDDPAASVEPEVDSDGSMDGDGSDVTGHTDSNSSSVLAMATTNGEVDDHHIASGPVVTRGEDITEDMTWVEGDVPFQDHDVTRQHQAPEHGR